MRVLPCINTAPPASVTRDVAVAEQKWRMPLLSHSSLLPDTIHTCHVTNVRMGAFSCRLVHTLHPFYPICELILRCLHFKTVPTPK